MKATKASGDPFDRHNGVLGQVGSGKSFTARGLVERWLDEKRRVCIVDPTGVWWGLRLNASGRRPSGYPVVVFGGEHGDVPIGETSGRRLAEIIGPRDQPVVIDTSEFASNAARQRFMTDFLETLYQSNPRIPLHLVLDEADDMAPQSPLPDGRRLLGAVERIVKRGRVRGFRVTFISQRSASLNKNVLTQAQTLVAMRMPAKQDRDAVEDWIKGQADVAEADRVLSSLSRLQIGEGWLWAPHHGILERQKFPPIKTFDSMRTPEAGEAAPDVAMLPPIDLGDLREQLAQQDEPPASAGKAGGKPVATQQDRAFTQRLIDQAKQEGYRLGSRIAWGACLEWCAGILAGSILKMIEGGGGVPMPPMDAAEKLNPLLTVEEIKRRTRMVLDVESSGQRAELPPPPAPLSDAPYVSESPRGDLHGRRIRTPAEAGMVERGKNRQNPSESAEKRSGAAERIIAAIARLDRPARWEEVGVVAGLITGNGYWYNGVKQLRQAGLIVEEGDLVRPPAPTGGTTPTPEELRELWRPKLKGPGPAMLDALLEHDDGAGLTSKELAEIVNLKPGNGYWYTGLKSLRTAGLMSEDRGTFRLVPLMRGEQ